MLLLMPALAAAVAIQGRLPSARPRELAGSYVTLRDVDTAALSRAYFTASGNFTLPSVGDGVYLLALESVDLDLPYVCKVVVTDNEPMAFRVDVGRALHAPNPKIDYPLELDGYRRREMYTERPVFTLWRFLKQPAVWMSLSTVAMVLLIPIINDSIDFEALQQATQDQPASTVAASLGSFDMAKAISDHRTRQKNM